MKSFKKWIKNGRKKWQPSRSSSKKIKMHKISQKKTQILKYYAVRAIKIFIHFTMSKKNFKFLFFLFLSNFSLFFAKILIFSNLFLISLMVNPFPSSFLSLFCFLFFSLLSYRYHHTSLVALIIIVILYSWIVDAFRAQIPLIYKPGRTCEIPAWFTSSTR